MEPLFINRIMSGAPVALAVSFYACFFFLGAGISDFLQCMLYRRERKIDIFIKRSFCDSCGRQLKWYNLVPVLGYAWTGGKCGYCGSAINPRYAVSDFCSGAAVTILSLSDVAILFFAVYFLVLVFMIAHDFLSQKVPVAALLLFAGANLAYALLARGQRVDWAIIALSVCAFALLAPAALFRSRAFRIACFALSALSVLGIARFGIAAAVSAITVGSYVAFITFTEKRLPRVMEIPFIGLCCVGFAAVLVHMK